MAIPTITIDTDKKCAECRQGGACQNGLCLKCTTRALQGKPMKSETGRAVQILIRETIGRHRDDRSGRDPE